MYMSKKVKEGQKMAKIKVAAIQMPTVTDKMQNVRTAGIYLEKIKDEKPDFVILPEMFCCPYQTQNFPVYAEEEGGPVWQQLSEYAKQYGIYLTVIRPSTVHRTDFISTVIINSDKIKRRSSLYRNGKI